jgi:hypothetical protein
MPLSVKPNEALEQYVAALETDYLAWYQWSVKMNFGGWQAAQATAMLASFGAAVLAALLTENQLKAFSTGRIFLVVLPLVASLASTILGQMRPREIMLVREAGREAIQNLIAEARAIYPSIAQDPAKLTEFHQQLAKRVSVIEQSQSMEFAKASAAQRNAAP